MSPYHDLFQRAIILSATMVLALIYGALDAAVRTTLMIHTVSPPESEYFISRTFTKVSESLFLLSLGTENISAEKIDIHRFLFYNE